MPPTTTTTTTRTTTTVVLVTGAFGNVGREAVSALLQRNAALHRGKSSPEWVDVVAFDRRSSDADAALAALRRRFGGAALRVVWGDLTKRDSVEEAVRVVEGVVRERTSLSLGGGGGNVHTAVIHLAAIIPPVAYRVPELARAVNVDGTRMLLEAFSHAQVQLPHPPRFVQASSYSVMGLHSAWEPGPLLHAESPLDPRDEYAKHKVECEHLVRAYPGEWVILRIGAVTPLFDRPVEGSLSDFIPLFFGVPAQQHRHGIASSDCGLAFANAALAPKEAVNGRVLMAGGDISWRMTAAVFNDATMWGSGLFPVIRATYRVPDKARKHEPWYYEDWMNTAESQRALGFQRTSFAEWSASAARKRSLAAQAAWCATRALVAPLAAAYFCVASPHFWHNVWGSPDPLRGVGVMDMVPGARSLR